jgi:hypothetical protein
MTHHDSLSAAAFAGQQIIYRGVRYSITEEPDLPDLLPDGTGTLLARNRRGDLVTLVVVAKDGRIVRAAALRGPWADVAVVNESRSITGHRPTA